MSDLSQQGTWSVPSPEHRYCTRCGYTKEGHSLETFCPSPVPETHPPADWATKDADRQRHEDSLADTGDAYSAFQGWILECLWCDFQAVTTTKAQGVEKIREHYRTTLGREVEIHG